MRTLRGFYWSYILLQAVLHEAVGAIPALHREMLVSSSPVVV